MDSSLRQRSSMLTLRWALPVFLLAVYLVGIQAQQPPTPPASPTPTGPQDVAQGEPVDGADDTATADTDAQSDVPVFRTGINVIRVDAIVTDGDGNHISDLEASDFEIYEDGVLQTIESFQLIEIDEIPAEGAEPPRRVRTRIDAEREAARTDVRVFVIFFDEYHVRWGNGRRASNQITEFLQRNLLPTDLVAVMYPLTPLMDLQLTRNHDLIIEQVGNWFGRKYDYEPTNEYEVSYAEYPTQTVELIRNHVSFSALRGLMIYLGGIREARKNVLLVSEGYSYYVPPQLRSSNAVLGPNSGENPAVRDPLAGESSFEQTSQLFQNTGLSMDLRRIFSTANRFNTAIYSVDPRGLAAQEFDVSQPNVGIMSDARALRGMQDTLRVLAEETDGRAIVNSNNLAPGLEQMMTDASAYYLIGYSSSQSPTDGKFHEIDVRVNRDGVNVRSRPGFWAMSERDAERALQAPLNEPPRAVDRALGSLAEPRRGHLVRTWIGTSRGKNGKTEVTFVWEPTRGQSSRLGEPDRILLTAMGDSGGAVYRGRVPEPEGTSSRGLAGSAGDGAAVTMARFDADPGLLQMSLAVEGDSGDVLDRDRDQIEIPDFTGPDLVFSTPAFVRARNNLEWEELVFDWEAVPTASREFRRTERILLRFEAYAPGTTVPEVTAWLLNRRGDRMFPLTVQPAEEGHPSQVDLQPTSLAPGEYVIELTATTSDDELVELVAFRLQS